MLHGQLVGDGGRFLCLSVPYFSYHIISAISYLSFLTNFSQRAEASVSRAQQLNPMVQVTADSEDVADKPDTFFGDFDVICATECPVEQLIRINQICREKGIKFFCGDVFGMFGYTFTDLQIHEYAE